MENETKNNEILWKSHDEWAEQVLNIPESYIWINKMPQVGCTTSIGKACLRLNKRFTEFAPTNKIIDDTVGNSIMEGKKFGKIGSNEKMCPNSSEPDFFGFQYTKCKDCDIDNRNVSYDYKCKYKEIIETDYKVHGLVYSKFNSIIFHRDENGEIINEDENYDSSIKKLKDLMVEKIFNSDVIMLDEFPRLIVYNPPGFFVEDLRYAYDNVKPKIERLILLNMEDFNDPKQAKKAKHYQQLLNIIRDLFNGIENTQLDKCKKEKKYGIYNNINKLELWEASSLGVSSMTSLNELRRRVIKLFDLNVYDNKENKKILTILQIILIALIYDEIWVTTKKRKVYDDLGNESTIESKYAFANIKHPFNIMKPYLEKFTAKGGKVIATGMKFPEIENSFDWKQVTMPDFNNTEEKHLVVCDTKDMSFKKPKFDECGKCIESDNWIREEKEIKQMILNVANSYSPLKVIVFAFNKNVYAKLNGWIEEIKKTETIVDNILIADSLCFTYFRSALGSGVRLDYPIKFYIGAADTPETSYDEAELLFDISSDKLRHIEMSDTFKNSIGRGKDPEGKQPSISFVIGAQKDKVLELFPEKKEIIEVFTQGTIYKLDRLYTYYWFERWNEIPIEELPMFIDAMRQTIDRYLSGKIQTSSYDLNQNWRQRKDFNLSTNDISYLMHKWTKSIRKYIIPKSRGFIWTIDRNYVKRNNIEFY